MRPGIKEVDDAFKGIFQYELKIDFSKLSDILKGLHLTAHTDSARITELEDSLKPLRDFVNLKISELDHKCEENSVFFSVISRLTINHSYQ